MLRKKGVTKENNRIYIIFINAIWNSVVKSIIIDE
jgi:hypothetical protein